MALTPGLAGKGRPSVTCWIGQGAHCKGHGNMGKIPSHRPALPPDKHLCSFEGAAWNLVGDSDNRLFCQCSWDKHGVIISYLLSIHSLFLFIYSSETIDSLAWFFCSIIICIEIRRRPRVGVWALLQFFDTRFNENTFFLSPLVSLFLVCTLSLALLLIRCEKRWKKLIHFGLGIYLYRFLFICPDPIRFFLSSRLFLYFSYGVFLWHYY